MQIGKKKRSLGSWLGGDSANMSIGQGYLLSTPLQMACYGASLARGEFRTQPTLLHDPNRPQLSTNHTDPIGLSKEHYQTLLHGMEKATLEGTAKRSKIANVSIAAKTGTAQVTVSGKERELAWYLGFAPIENPEIALIVMIEETEDNQHYGGGKTAAPPARRIFKKYFQDKENTLLTQTDG